MAPIFSGSKFVCLQALRNWALMVEFGFTYHNTCDYQQWEKKPIEVGDYCLSSRLKKLNMVEKGVYAQHYTKT